ncbi:MAG: holo-ACP synthase [Acidimicrobiaceae bacterium]|nr:holo-ACP synthase [Acidimicrobiaceae bacterium]MCY3642255.1 holo-ACP synthase [Acidimicrobiaceae bacterium]MDE0494206.1 holo-ACP synthase [Acidimicrobiaceae bacterium]MDE0667040.1 holo-ACP synthase [Acidimicrobiaceae bacterium]MXW89400.1 holo-ACP synthase [Acidimicrobiaceae bacterium]
MAGSAAAPGNAGVVGIGIDLVDIDRFRTVLRRRPSVAERLFTAGERTYAKRAADPAARLAARFAAKEAALKALGYGLGGMRLADIEVVRDGDGRPELVLHGDARSRAETHGVGRWLVSLSHTDHLAQATVVALAR